MLWNSYRQLITVLVINGVLEVWCSHNRQMESLREACRPGFGHDFAHTENRIHDCQVTGTADSANVRHALRLHRLSVEIWYFVSVREYPLFGMWNYLLENLQSRGGVVSGIRVYQFFDAYNTTIDSLLKRQMRPSDTDFVSFHNTSLTDLFYGRVYFDAVRSDFLFIKIDDDVAYASKNAINELVDTYINNVRIGQESILVTANVVNAFGFGPVHQYTNAVRYDHDSSAFTNHDSSKMYTTLNDEFHANHGAIIEGLQKQATASFNFGLWSQTEDCRSKQRIGLNFVLFPSLTVTEYHEMMDLRAFNKDEVYLTRIRGRMKSAPTTVVGSALVVHLSSAPQREVLSPGRMGLSHSDEHFLVPLHNLAVVYASAMRSDCCQSSKCPLFKAVGDILSSVPIQPYWQLVPAIIQTEPVVETADNIAVDKIQRKVPTTTTGVVVKTRLIPNDGRAEGRLARTIVLLLGVLTTVISVTRLHRSRDRRTD